MLTKECANQCFKYDHNKRYAPLVKIDTLHLQELLQTRLNFSYPENIHTMEPLDAVNWYSKDGVSTAISNLNQILHGAQGDKKGESSKAKDKDSNKARAKGNRKDKGTGKEKEHHMSNTSKETAAIRRHSPTPDSDDSANQTGSSGKNTRKAPNSLQAEERASKRAKPSTSVEVIKKTTLPHFTKTSGNVPAQSLPSSFGKDSSVATQVNGDVNMQETSPSPPPTPKKK